MPRPSQNVHRNKARNRYECRLTIGYTPEGKQIRRLFSGKTADEVRTKMRAVEGVRLDSPLAKTTVTVAEFLEVWVSMLPGMNLGKLTIKSYRFYVKQFLIPHLGTTRLRSLQPMQVTQMLMAMEQDGKAPDTRRLARSTLRRALRWGMQQEVLTRNVADLTDGVKRNRGSARAKRSLTPAQAKTLLVHLQETGDRRRAMFVVGLGLGLRTGEILGLAWDQVFLEGPRPYLRIARVQRWLGGVEGAELGNVADNKGGGRKLALLPFVVDALRAHRAQTNRERLAIGAAWPAEPLGHGADLLWRNEMGEPLTPPNFGRICSKTTAEAGIGPWPPHQLFRHSLASLLASEGVPIQVVSEFLGHSSIQITADVYSHLFDDALDVPAAAVAAALFGE